jgi:hypothetical protein
MISTHGCQLAEVRSMSLGSVRRDPPAVISRFGRLTGHPGNGEIEMEILPLLYTIVDVICFFLA